MQLESFELEASPETPARVVSSFYGTNQKYYDGDAIPNKSIGSLEFEGQVYYNMITDKGDTAFDVRRGTVEIQCDAAIPLAAGSVLAVALANTLLDKTFVEEKLRAWGAEVLSYHIHHAEPATFVRDISIKVREYLERNHYL